MKFSVIIPTYSRVNFLQKAIESVNNQTYQGYEIIVINDNPEEKSQIDDLVSGFNKITVIHHTQSKGGNAARNTGIANSSGELIAFLDDDDSWLPEKLTWHLKKHEEQPDAGLVFSECLYVYNNPYIENRITSSHLPINITKAMGKGKFCPDTSSAVTIKRECVKRCGLFDENLVSFQDWDFWFRIAYFFPFAHIPVMLVHYKQHLGDRTSHNEYKSRIGINQICEKWKKEIDVASFSKVFICSIHYKNSINALLAGKKINAIKKSLPLLHPEVVSFNSIKNFIKMLLVLFKRKKAFKPGVQ